MLSPRFSCGWAWSRISFLEAPLKFRSPGATLPIGLAIGRLVFRALNTVEMVLAVIVIGAFAVDTPRTATTVAVAIAVLALSSNWS